MKKEETALESFRSGLNCSQSVLKVYCDRLNIDKDLAMNISCGFGGGMGRLQETCGAVTGSYMVLGLFNGKKFPDNKDKKERTYSMIQMFSKRFKSIHGTTDCKSLLNCDLNTEEGQLYAKENKLFETLCEQCISDSIKVLEDLLQDQNLT